MYSPRSVSTASIPAASSAGLSSISSVVIDLPLTTRLAPPPRATFDDIVAGLGGVGGDEDLDAVGLEPVLELDQEFIEAADGLLLDSAGGLAFVVEPRKIRASGGDLIEMASCRLLQLAPELGVGDTGATGREEVVSWFRRQRPLSRCGHGN